MKVIISGGGTGGHVYPAIAIADKIMRKIPDSEVLFVGTRRGMESRLVPERGYGIKYISARGLDRKNPFKNIAVLKELIKGNKEVGKIINEFKPDMVIGTGGYVSAPVLFAAVRKKIPVFIHEQNAYPGLANRMLSRYAKKIFVSFPESEKYFKQKDKIVLTGNPVRKEFAASGLVDYREKLGIGPGEFFVLSFGGSRGAEKINEAVMELVEIINKIPGAKLVHITGAHYYESFCEKLMKKTIDIKGGDKVRILPYTDKIHEYMMAADLIISRAGAITVAEITACGKPAILIPSPNVTANHQFFNAKSLSDKGGAVLIEEKDLTKGKLENVVMRLMNNKEAINRMGDASRDLGRIDGADEIFIGLDTSTYNR